MACPHIKGFAEPELGQENDTTNGVAPEPQTAKKSGGVCPFTGKKTGEDVPVTTTTAATTEQATEAAGGEAEQAAPRSSMDIDIDEINEKDPSIREYKKLKRIMGVITQFYKDGTQLKKGHFEAMTAEIAKLDVDLQMTEDQRKAILDNKAFTGHPKQKEFLRQLQSEKDRLEAQRQQFEEKLQEYKSLYEWSTGIVRVCEWLELHLDDYCSKTLNYPKLKDAPPTPALAKEEATMYARGLEEITHNLRESQDFFKASVDGRLKKYHQLEKEMIEAQLEAIRKYPEENERRQCVEEELLQDLAFVEGNMGDEPGAMKRREKMLENHSDFLKVLRFHKEKLKVLYLENADAVEEIKFDSRYDHYRDD
ncbi:BAR domain-containing protein [Balamuthia mandrillaris]